MKLLLTLLVTISGIAIAANSPANFPTNNSKAVFVDFIKANYTVKYDAKNDVASAYSVIEFTQSELGTPIFDLKENIKSIVINGEDTKSMSINSPGNTTEYMTISKVLPKGTHTLEIRNEINENIRFEKGGVQSAFWMSDLKDRTYLEQYLPTNVEFDHYKMDLNVKFIGNRTAQKIYTNGAVTKVSATEFNISYPEYFTASSMFFHTATDGRFKEVKSQYKSINGKIIPLIVYSKSSWNLKSAMSQSKDVLAELEEKLGAWSHPSLVVYVAGQGGMEYCGATITSMAALGHEITHSFFARGVMPINGNSGWMDEAIASWRDKGYKSTSKPSFSSTSMAAHSQYKRTTDRKAYTEGANFMAYLNHNLTNLGGLEKFLSNMYGKYVHTSINTETFRSELENFSGLNFEKDFNKYIYGQGKKSKSSSMRKSNPFHPELSKAQLQNLL
jgi:hypothetical protein